MSKFNYKKAEAGLHDAGAKHPEEIYEYRSEKAIRGFMKENGLKPDKYYHSGSTGPHSGSNPGSDGNDSGACYLTTACVVAKGLPDQCDELQTLRAFRDEYLPKRPGGCRDIEDYYAMAPGIVEAINGLSHAAETWNQIYAELVVPCVQMIKNNRNEQAYHLYKTYSLALYKKFAGPSA